MKKTKTIKRSIFLTIAVGLLFVAGMTMAKAASYEEATGATKVGDNYIKGNSAQLHAFNSQAGIASSEGANTVPNLVATVIKTVLGLLGIIFVVLIIIAGFKWMMAGGNEKDVDDAQKRIKNSIIGLLIVLSAYAITAFVFNHLPSSSRTDSNSGGPVVTGG